MRKLLSCSYNLRRNGHNRQRRKKEQYRPRHMGQMLQSNSYRNEHQQPVHWTTQESAQRRLMRCYICKVTDCIVDCRHIIPFTQKPIGCHVMWKSKRNYLSEVTGITGFARKSSSHLGKRNTSHAKAQRNPLETRQRFAPLRLCVRDLLLTVNLQHHRGCRRFLEGRHLPPDVHRPDLENSVWMK